MDSGTHTCNATDVWGHSGTATVVMNVTGKALAYVGASVALPPNKKNNNNLHAALPVLYI